MYTLPFTTNGGTYFPNVPTESRAGTSWLFQISSRVSEFRDRRMPGTTALSALALIGMEAHTIPVLGFSLLADNARMAPGEPKEALIVPVRTGAVPKVLPLK